MEGTFFIWMVGVAVLVAAQVVEYIRESSEPRCARPRVPRFVRDLLPGDATAAQERTFEYERAA